MFAVIGGILFGTMTFPEEFVSDDQSLAYFLPSCSVGILIFLIINILYAIWIKSTLHDDHDDHDDHGSGINIPITSDDGAQRRVKCINIFSQENLMSGPFYVYQCFVPGFISGIIWGLSFLFTLYAQDMIGYELAIPIKESSLALSAMIGIYIFNEINDKYSILFVAICSSLIIAGCFALSLSIYA